MPSKSIGALAKVGERNPIISLPHRLLSPFLGILILSLRDMILFLLRWDLVCLDQGCGALPPLPTFMWVPPCRRAPLRNLLEPSRYNTEKSRTFSGGSGGLQWRNSRSRFCSGSFMIRRYIWVQGVRRWSYGGPTRQGAHPHPREHLPYLLTWGPSPSGGFPSKNNLSS